MISLEEHISGGSNIDPDYRAKLLSYLHNMKQKGFWISLNVEETMAHLTKWSFDEHHRQPIAYLGGITAIAEFIRIEHGAHLCICSRLHGQSGEGIGSYKKSHKTCLEARRYAVVALTNMTFGNAKIKSFLCTFPHFIMLMVKQLQLNDEDDEHHHYKTLVKDYNMSEQHNYSSENAVGGLENLRKATAHLFRNLGWKADKNSKQILSDSEVVAVLMRAAMDVTAAAVVVIEGRGKHPSQSYADYFSTYKKLPKEPKQVESSLKVILNALWNLSAHCRKNKVSFSSM